ncbi:MAG: Immunoglobulin-like repeat containing protein domain [Bacteroidetes bacterium]|jgi:gliding motility-associated-like protein|nr:Immunoglobulin-like repeat containing protein domain [Bacteroidota bacterium]
MAGLSTSCMFGERINYPKLIIPVMKTYLTLPVIFFLIVCSSFVKAQPTNTTCGTALNLTNVSNFCSAAGQYTNVNGGVGTTFGKPACWPLPYSNAISRDVWFSFTATAANVAITVNGNTMSLGTLNNPQVALYSGNCALALTTEACGVSAPGSHTVTIGATTLVPGLTYLIRVDGYNSSEGTFQLCVNNSAVSPIPSNDDCGAPTILSNVTNFCSSPAIYTNVLASNSSYGAPTCWLNTTNDVWFQFTAVAPAINIVVNGNNVSPGTLSRPQIALYSGSCLAVVFQEGCDTAAPGSGTASLNIGGLVTGTTYLIRIDGMNGNTGTFQLCVNNFNPPVIPGQDCGTATPLCTKDPFTVNNITGFGTNGQEAAGSCLAGGVSTSGNTEQNSVWYTWTAANNGTLTFDLVPTTPGIDIDFVVYQFNATGCAGRTMIRCEAASCLGSTGLNATEIDVAEPFDCNPPNNNYLQQLNMTAGTTYGLLVNMFQTLGAGFTINFGGTGQFAGPVPNFTYVKNLSCTANKTVTFTNSSTGATSYAWTFGSGSSPATANTAGPFTVTYSTPGLKTATLTVIGAGGCDSVIYKQFTIADTLSLTTVNVNSTCQAANGSITVNAAGGNGSLSTFQYSLNGGAFQSSNLFSGLSAGTYTVTVKDSTACLKSKVVNITTTTNPTANITPSPASTCAGISLLLNGNPSGGTTPYITHAWSGSGASSLTSGNTTASPTFNNSTAGNYTVVYTVTDNAGCTGSASTIITVKPKPTAAITPSPATVCAGSNLSLNGNPAGGSGTYTHNWSGTGSGSLSAGSSTATPTFNNATSGTYTLLYTVTDNQGCFGTASISVLVNPRPVITSATGTNTSACGISDGSITINATGTGLTYSINGGTTFVAGNTFTSLAAGSYQVIVKNSAGCTTSGGTISISSAGAPAQPTASASPNPLCEGTSFTLSVTPVAGQTYNWTGPGYAASGASVTRTATTPSMSGVYAVTANSGGCVSVAGTVTVTVNAKPTASVTPSPATVCAGNDLALNGNPTGGSGTYSSHAWTGVGAASLTAGTATSTPTFNNSIAGSYALTYTVTDNNGCSGTATRTVLVNANPSSSINPSPASVCEGIDLNLNGNPTEGSGIYTSHSWSGNGSAFLTSGSSGATPTYNHGTAGSYTLIYTVTDNNGCIGSATTNVTVNDNPVTNIAPFPASVCAGSNLLLNANPTGGSGTYSTHDWTGIGASSLITGSATASPTFNNSSAGNYLLNYSVTDNNGCIGTSSTTVSVNSNPTASISPSPATVCSGVDLVLNGDPSGGSGIYTLNNWIGTGASSLTSNATTAAPTFNNLVAGNYSLTYSVTDNQGCSGSATTTVLVNSNPSVTISPSPAIVCAGTNLVMNGNPSGGSGTYSSHVWTGTGAGSLIAGSSTDSPTFNNSTGGSYSLIYTVTDNNGCIDSASANLTVNANPTASISPSPAQTCEGADLILNSNPTGGSGIYSSHTWTGSGAASLITGASTSTPIFNSSLAGSYTLNYTVTDNNGCTGTTTTSILVNPNPTASVTPTPAAVCPGNDLSLNGNPSGGSGIFVSHSWNGTGASSLTGGTTATPIFNNSVSGAYSLTYVVTDNNGCIGTTTTSVTVNPSPAAPIATSPSAYCSGASIADLTASGTGGTLTWYSDAALTNPVGTGNTFTSGATSTSTFYVIETSGGCQGNASPVTITVNSTPTAPAATSPAAYCQGASIADLTASGSGGTFTWYSDAALTNQIGTGSTFTSGATSTTTYYVTETKTGCEGNATAVTITVNAQPSAPSASNPSPYCSGAAVADLTASGSGGTLTWYSDAALTNLVGNGNQFTSGATSTSTYYVTETQLGCESSATTVLITINAPVNTSFTATPVSGPAPLPVTVESNNSNASAWTWSFGNGEVASGSEAATTYMNTGTYPLIYTIIENGCTGTDSVSILVYENFSILIPNVFTPNSDNSNDLLKLSFTGIEKSSITIYNRWGTKMFSSEDAAETAWDGKDEDGQEAPAGTYFYTLSYRPIQQQEKTQSGFINLLR